MLRLLNCCCGGLNIRGSLDASCIQVAHRAAAAHQQFPVALHIQGYTAGFLSIVTPPRTPPITRIQMSETPSAAATLLPCRTWARSGKCHHGSLCRFLHQPPAPAPPGSAAQSLAAPAALSLASPAQRRSKKRKADDAFILDTTGDVSLLSASGLGGTCEGVCGNTDATGPPLKKNSGDVVSVKSWPTNKSRVVRLFKFENVELDASCFQRTSLLALAALAGVNSQATSAIKRRVPFAFLTPRSAPDIWSNLPVCTHSMSSSSCTSV